MVDAVLGRITARIATNGIATVITTNRSNTIASSVINYTSSSLKNNINLVDMITIDILLLVIIYLFFSSFKNNINLAYMIRVLVYVVIVVVLIKL